MQRTFTQGILIPITRGQRACLFSVVRQSNHHQEMTRWCSSDNDEMSYNLTKDEAVTFLENILGIPDPVSFMNNDKVAFLQEMIRQFKLKIPFTNLMAVSFREHGIRIPSFSEMKHAIHKQQGGHCLALNTFTSAVLQSLGLKTYLIGGSIHRWKFPLINNHTAVITKHLTAPGSLHLVDVGSQYFLPLISLDFDRISQIYTTRGLKYRVYQVSPGVVQLTWKCGPPKSRRVDGLIYTENKEFWEVRTTFSTFTPRQMDECYYLTNSFLQNLKLGARGMYSIWMYGFHNNLSVSILDNQCLTATETGYTEVTKLEGTSHAIDTILKYFPQYPQDQLEKMAEFLAGVKSSS